jgi:SAM-dependent methyltransferase
MNFKNDPVGLALHDYEAGKKTESILVTSDLCDDDEIPVAHLFRSFDEMPELEKIALSFCKGKILDVGAGAGCHSIYLHKNFETLSIDISQGAVNLMNQKGLNAHRKTIFEIENEKFDTILLLMNGIGLAGSIEKLPAFLMQLKKLLNEGGKIICDSTDLSYLYTDDDGSFMIDLNAKYYGEMQFNMIYQKEETGWFDWLYIDGDNLTDIANRCGLKCTLLFEGDTNHYLVSLEHQ